MSKAYAVLPCNGLDKCAGCISREIALQICEESDSAMICPVLYRTAAARYDALAKEKPLLVIDGCGTRCASKLAAEKGLKIAEKVNVTEAAREMGFTLGRDLRLGDGDYEAAAAISAALLKEIAGDGGAREGVAFPESLDYATYTKDKFIFRVPRNPGFYFNENDVWAYVDGDKARIGVTDFVQKSLSDIMFFDPIALGAEIDQFDEAGSIESGKAVFEIVSPVAGTVTAVNDKLLEAPELINDNPYEKGWIAEIALADLEEDAELLCGFDGYFEILKRKVDEFHV